MKTETANEKNRIQSKSIQNFQKKYIHSVVRYYPQVAMKREHICFLIGCNEKPSDRLTRRCAYTEGGAAGVFALT
jgi:hypothetical protein